MEHRRQVSKAEIERARELDLLTYLQTYEPHELVRISSAVYSTRSHDSLKISNGKWFQWSTGVGGVSALDYLVKVQGMDFVSAVLRVLECTRYATPTKTYTPKRAKPTDFVLPAPHENNDRVAAYLTGRGLSEDLLNMYFNMGLVYEDRRHNCVFVGFDKDTVPRYAMLRSSDPSSTFLREVEGSDKRYSFRLPLQEHSHRLFLFESAIDCLSFAELQRMASDDWKPDNYLSLSGVYQPKKELSETPLPIALVQFLQDNPHINHIVLCLDNDEAGIKAAMAICALLPKRYTTELLPPEVGKDYNEQLMAAKNITSHIRTRGAKSALRHFKEETQR
ncbi:MAG: DUF3991 and toprim domain-containing protein [Christensenellales bacterium]|jgi:hypothetical protein